MLKFPELSIKRAKTITACFRVTRDEKDLLKKLGGGSISIGMRIAICSIREDAMKHIEKVEQLDQKVPKVKLRKAVK